MKLGKQQQPPRWNEHFHFLLAQSQDPALQLYYAAGVPLAETPIEQVPMVAMDFETTGLDANNDEIVSIGVVPFTLQRIFCGQAQEWVVKPKQPMDESSVVIHGITHSVLKRAPDLDRVLAPLLHALAGSVVVVHYHPIERTFLNRALKSEIGEGIEFPVIDTMELERRALMVRQGVMGRLMRKPLGSLRLADCRKRYSLPHYEAHIASTDALATAELLQAQIAYHFRSDTPVGELWC